MMRDRDGEEDGKEGVEERLSPSLQVGEEEEGQGGVKKGQEADEGLSLSCNSNKGK